MLATIKGESTEQIPFVPRMDLWYTANRRAGTLPSPYKNASLMEIVDDLGIGYHGVVPDFREFYDPLDDVDRALGIWRIKGIPYRTVLRGIKRNISYEGDATTVEYLTPKGTIRTKTRYTKESEKAGITLTDIVERAIKSEDDYEAIAYIFEHAEVIPDYDNYLEYKERVGHRGLCVAFANLAASPMHAIQRYLLDYNTFFIEIMDNPHGLEWLANEIQGYFHRLFEVVANSPAEVVLSGANYDSTVTYPPLFKKFFVPPLKRQADRLHSAGKFLLTHTDGDNKGLLDHYLAADFDIADSVCPSPMTSLTLKDHIDAFKGQITIWGGVPSVAVLEHSMSEVKFDHYLEDLFENQISRGDHLIISIADTLPPDAKFERMKKIIKVCEEFGPVKP